MHQWRLPGAKSDDQPAVEGRAAADCGMGAGLFARQPAESRIGPALQSDRAARADDVGERAGEEGTLAKAEGQRDAAVHARAAHWRWYDLDRLPDDPKLWARAAKILRQLPEARVGVGPKPITAAEAAEQALKKAGTEGLGFRLLTFSVTTGWKPIPLARNRKSNGKNGLPSGA